MRTGLTEFKLKPWRVGKQTQAQIWHCRACVKLEQRGAIIPGARATPRRQTQLSSSPSQRHGRACGDPGWRWGLVLVQEASAGHVLLNGLRAGRQRVLQGPPLHSLVSHIHKHAIVLSGKPRTLPLPSGWFGCLFGGGAAAASHPNCGRWLSGGGDLGCSSGGAAGGWHSQVNWLLSGRGDVHGSLVLLGGKEELGHHRGQAQSLGHCEGGISGGR